MHRTLWHSSDGRWEIAFWEYEKNPYYSRRVEVWDDYHGWLLTRRDRWGYILFESPSAIPQFVKDKVKKVYDLLDCLTDWLIHP